MTGNGHDDICVSRASGHIRLQTASAARRRLRRGCGRVSGISHPPINPAELQSVAFRFSQQVAQDFAMDAANAARARQGVKVNQKLLTSLTSSNQ